MDTAKAKGPLLSSVGTSKWIRWMESHPDGAFEALRLFILRQIQCCQLLFHQSRRLFFQLEIFVARMAISSPIWQLCFHIFIYIYALRWLLRNSSRESSVGGVFFFYIRSDVWDNFEIFFKGSLICCIASIKINKRVAIS